MGSTIDAIFNIGGGRCQTHRQRPLEGPPSTSFSTSMVDAAGPTIDVFNIGGGCYRTRWQRPQGARHRRLLQPWWWMLLDPLAERPRGPAISVIFNIGGGRCRTHR
jgi:hypothetical protein